MPVTINATSLGTNGIVIRGAGDYAQIGRSVSSAGDFNGDGIEDFVFTGPVTDAVNGGRGVIYLIFGRVGGLGAIDLANLSPSDGFALFGPTPGFGEGDLGVDMTAAVAGDLNNDGYDDLIVGFPRADPLGGGFGNWAGRAYIVYGRSGTWASTNLSALTPSQASTLTLTPSVGTGQDGAFLGDGISAAGDVNGDGFDDIIIGASNESTGASYVGRSFVVYGSANGIPSMNLANLTQTQGFSVSGVAASSFSGMEVAGLGDINGDGIGDFAISAAHTNGLAGAVYVYYGTVGTRPSFSLGPIPVTDGFVISGFSSETRVGWSLASAGDVNGDGFEDLIFSNGAFANGNYSYLIFGSAGGPGAIDLQNLTTSQGFRIQAPAGSMGGTVGGAGDVNGDGFDDLLVGIGNGNLSGTVYVVYGGASLTSVTLGASDGLVVTGPPIGDAFGSSVSYADVNNDGTSEILIGGWRSDTPGFARGSVYVINGVLPTSSVNLSGTAGNNSYAGSNLDDVLSGAQGDDRLFGNGGNDVLDGGIGNDYLNGGSGTDALTGGVGDDTYVIDASDTFTELAGEGIDTIRTDISTYTLPENFENLAYFGTGTFTGTGTADANIIMGGVGNDFLDGGLGADRLIGDRGDDTFTVDNLGDVVVERANEGTDTVQTLVNYVLPTGASIEFLSALAVPGNSSVQYALTGNELGQTISGLDGDDSLYGMAGADRLNGNGGNDLLDGGLGDDDMAGALGDDTYFVDSAGDAVREAAAGGNDLVNTTVSYALNVNAEVETLRALDASGVATINLTGNGFNNAIQGNAGSNLLQGLGGDDALFGYAGNDVLDGGFGADSMSGGLGDDIFIVESAGDTVTDEGGFDRVDASISFAIGAGIENLTLTGTAAIDGTGNAIDNIIVGNSAANILSGGDGNDTINGGSGNDRLIGGAGADSMDGGLGDDIFVIDDVGDTIVDSSGIDLVEASISYALGAAIENLTLTGSAAIDATGNALVNILVGNDADNLLSGLGGSDTLRGGNGNDRLDGGTGADVMDGGLGDDVFIVDSSSDSVVDAGGTDRVESFTSYTLGIGIENLTLLGTAQLNGAGNADNNVLVGNSANNRLDGAAGIDQLYGGLGNDIYVVDRQDDIVFENAGEGTDIVESSGNFYLYANIERLTLTGNANIFGVGNEMSNIITGNAGENLLIAGAGADTVNGGGSRDAIFGEAGDDILNGDAGIDYIVAGVGNDTLDGGADADEMYGQEGDDIMRGGATFDTDIMVGGTGRDTLYGNSGLGDYDLLYGNEGNDIFYVDTPDDLVFEQAGEGIDTVYADINGAGYYLYGNIENLVLLDDTPFGVGNASDNNMTGNAIGNYLLGGAGNDTLNGMGGNDVLFGETGNDIFVFDQGTGGDVIGDFARGEDRIDISAYGMTFAQVQARFVQNGNVGAIQFANGDVIVLHNVTMSQLTASDFVLAPVSEAPAKADDLGSAFSDDDMGILFADNSLQRWQPILENVYI